MLDSYYTHREKFALRLIPFYGAFEFARVVVRVLVGSLDSSLLSTLNVTWIQS